MSSSIIPKISLGLNSKRSKFNLSQDTSTTADFGFCQPTFCREMIPNATFKMNGVEQFIRLAPVTVPTFGRVSYRTYHAFVPYSSLYFPFDSFLAGTAYTNASGTSFRPLRIPTFNFAGLISDIMSDSTQGERYFEVYTSQSESTYYAHENSYRITNIQSTIHFNSDDHNSDYDYEIEGDGTAPTLRVVFLPAFQRLFKVFVGLGYNFDANSTVEFSVLKLLAYYKAWFNHMFVQRDINFFNTNCYKLIQVFSNADGKPYASWTSANKLLFYQFLNDLDSLYYNLPADYFSMSLTSAINVNIPVIIDSYNALNNYYSASADNTNVEAYAPEYPIIQKMAKSLLSFVNKNTVFGKSIRDYLQNTFGITDPHDNIHEEVVKIGAHSTAIQISDVMSTSDTYDSETNSGSPIGEYAAKGIGFSKSEAYEYTAKQFGVWIAFSCIVPEGGYVQGYVRENTNVDRFDFATPEFDALGYQLLQQGELIADYRHVYSPNKERYNPENGWGLVPRYSNYKVGRNILNGDLFRPSTRDVYSCYTLDRLFQSQNGYMVPVNHTDFRSVGKIYQYGRYDRIFDDTDPRNDHFIIHMIFNCDALMPLKSLSSSYDTFDEETDNTVMSVNKQ